MTLKCSVLSSLTHVRVVDYGNIWKSYSCSSLLLRRIALQSSVGLQATAALLPGGTALIPIAGSFMV